MLFELKKLISIFLMPLSIGLIFLFLGILFLYLKKDKKAKLFLVFSFFWIFLTSYLPFSNLLLKPLENEYKAYLDVNPTIKYVMVLGHAHVTNSEISPHSQLSGSALMRLTEGIRIFKKLDNAKLIVSGYAGDDDITPHAIISKNVAISMGVDENSIITFEKSKDTKEESIFAKELVKNEKLILVTSAFHMKRAVKLFKEENIDLIPAPTDFLAKEENDYLREPNSKELRKTELAFHEYLGIAWATLVEKIRFYFN